MDPFDTNELVNTVVHQAHVIRRLELALASQAGQIAALQAQVPDEPAPLASADQQTDTPPTEDPLMTSQHDR